MTSRRAFLGATLGATSLFARSSAAAEAGSGRIKALALDGFTTFDPRPLAAFTHHVSARRAPGKLEPRADATPPSRPHHRLPPVATDRAEEQQLDWLAALAHAQHPRGNHPAPVRDEAVPWAQQPLEIREPAILDPARRAIQHQQPRRVPRLRRLLRNQLRRQLIVEQPHVHGA